MQIVGDERVLEFCLGDEQERLLILDSYTAGSSRPVAVLPVLELCLAIHKGAIECDLDPRLFRACWSDFVLTLCERTDGYGDFIHVIHPDSAERDVIDWMLELGPTEGLPVPQADGDPRDIPSLHRALLARFRKLDSRFAGMLPGDSPERRRYMTNPPVDLPDADFRELPSDESVVIDSNNLLELLKVLPTDKAPGASMRLPEQIPIEAVKRFRRAVNSFGGTGHVIVPASVLEETERVATTKDALYGHVREVLQAIAVDPERPLWSIFRVDPLSQETLNAFLHLYEALFAHGIDKTRWPHFGDALVIAHGIANGCPIATTEWNNPGWAEVRGIFSHLAL